MKINDFFKRIFSVRLLIGIIIGGALGYVYYHFWGCQGNSCPIWANPYRSTLIGMAFGGVLLLDTSKKPKDDSTPQL
ncbi:MAG TPA: DUF6132 family protein [Perlabentimonas sp.]|nr:DUF6132 family protein [Perlabentimonas sp.]